jgi:hypothetical protein
MIDKATASTLYLDLLVPWEIKIKSLEPKGSFSLRAKAFTEFKRINNIHFKVEKTGTESDFSIRRLQSSELKAEQIVIVAKGDNSGARSLLRHSRNSVAHANVRKIKIKNNNYIIFSASNKNKRLLYVQIKQSNLKQYIAAIKSTVKNV